jgi:predicted transport protein
MSEKRVLIELNQNRKQVVFEASTGVLDVIVLKKAIKSSFGIELNESQDLLVQRKNEEWVGLWVDVEGNEEVYDRSLMKVVVISLKVRIVSALYY